VFRSELHHFWKQFFGRQCPEIAFDSGAQIRVWFWDLDYFGTQPHGSLIFIEARLDTDQLSAKQNFTSNRPFDRSLGKTCEALKLAFQPRLIPFHKTERLRRRAKTGDGHLRLALAVQPKKIPACPRVAFNYEQNLARVEGQSLPGTRALLRIPVKSKLHEGQ